MDASLPGIEALADSARQGLLTVEALSRHSFFGRDDRLWDAYVREMMDPSHHDAQAEEMRAMDESARQVKAGGDLADLPWAVLSSAREFDQYRGTPIPVEAANPHTVQYDEPRIVAGLIAELVRRVRERPTGP